MKTLTALRLPGCIILGIAAAVTVLLQYTLNLSDNDIWFTMAYGRYFLENHTIVPDHTIFSWTPAVNTTIYCTWIPSLFYTLVHTAGGMDALFMLRYVVAAAFAALAWSYAGRKSVSSVPLILLILLVGLKMTTSGIRIKAELFSFLFMTLMVWLWFTMKDSAGKGGGKSGLLWYAYPCLMLLWVNSHGGFIFGLAFLVALAAGEVLNRVLSPARSQAPKTLTHLLAAVFLSFVAVLFNPYGWAYPNQLLHTLILDPGEFTRHVSTVMEYQNVFFPAARHLLFVDALAAALCILVPLTVAYARKHRPDWAILLTNALFLLIYVRYLRTTYFWGVLFVFTALYLAKEVSRSYPGFLSGKPVGSVIQTAIVCALLIFAVRAQYYALISPDFGFRLNYQNPVEETEFIRMNFPRATRIGNDYNPGPYLMWALGPRKKVLIDARYFPYAQWYDEYNEFFSTDDTALRSRFLKKYPCDLWLVTYNSPHLQYFLASPGWRLVFYGQSACVFLPVDRAYHGAVRAASSIADVSFHQALLITPFALQVENYELAMDLLKRLKPLPFSKDQRDSAVGALGNAGNTLLSRNRVNDAVAVYERILAIDPGSAQAYLMMGKAYLKRKDLEQAVACFRESVRLDPGSLGGRRSLASAYVQINRLEEAAREYAEALRIAPEDAGIRNGMDMVRQRIEALDAQTAAMNQALKTQPGSLKLLSLLAQYSAITGRYEEAAAHLKKISEMTPENPEVYYNIACMYSMLGRTDEAEAWIERAMEKGFNKWRLLQTDPDLANLRKTGFYKSLLKKL